MKCLPYKVAIILAVIGGVAWCIYWSACTYTTTVDLSDTVRVVITCRTDRYGGEFASRSVDIFMKRKHLRRIWCGPLATRTGATGVFVSLCKGEFSEYVAVNDQYEYWIVSLRDPKEIRVAFPEKKPPVIEAEYNVSDLGNVLPMPKNFSYWIEGLNRKRSLLDEPAAK